MHTRLHKLGVISCICRSWRTQCITIIPPGKIKPATAHVCDGGPHDEHAAAEGDPNCLAVGLCGRLNLDLTRDSRSDGPRRYGRSSWPMHEASLRFENHVFLLRVGRAESLLHSICNIGSLFILTMIKNEAVKVKLF